MVRYIFITGGVLSSLGKGLASASLASLLQSRGYTVRLRKLDPYLNVDPGTMSPIRHGEVFVTDDGAETDLDLGHYERFTDVPARATDNLTAGKVYSQVLDQERQGHFNGEDVQVIPHITNAIKDFIQSDADGVDFMLCEVGGTVGDIEILPFLEAIRQLRGEVGPANTMFVHLTLLPYIPAAKELKTKPSQHSVKELQRAGIQPDILLCRSDRAFEDSIKRKLALFCNVPQERVIEALDVDSIYKVPMEYHKCGLDVEVCKYFKLPTESKVDLSKWSQIVEKVAAKERKVSIGVVGKYVELQDAYKSLHEALIHGAANNLVELECRWIDSEEIEKTGDISELQECDGILVPGGFGVRGAEGKILAAQYAREHNVPYLGICFGMQMAVVEFAQNVIGLKDLHSTELYPNKEPLVGLMQEWVKDGKVEVRTKDTPLGGTMRLGAYPCKLTPGSKAANAYGTTEILERHRHRYEVNANYRDKLEAAGLKFTGMSPDNKLPEIVEVEGHPWFVGVQFHPEFKSRPFNPHPLFSAFIEASASGCEKVDTESEKKYATG